MLKIPNGEIKNTEMPVKVAGKRKFS